MKKVGEKIVDLLKQMNMTQKELADLINVSEVNLSRYLTGERNLNIDTLSNIATALHTTTDFLLGKTEQVDDIGYKDVERLLARKAKTMDKEQKKKLLDILFLA